jgi:hypothetical protein
LIIIAWDTNIISSILWYWRSQKYADHYNLWWRASSARWISFHGNIEWNCNQINKWHNPILIQCATHLYIGIPYEYEWRGLLRCNVGRTISRHHGRSLRHEIVIKKQLYYITFVIASFFHNVFYNLLNIFV